MTTTATESTGLVLLQRQDHMATITINRPAQRNAINHRLALQLASALDQLDADPDIAVGVLTGAGGTFCAGMDLKAFAQGESPIIAGRGFGGLTRAKVRKPLIAAVEGWALGGGFELALACDLIVAAEDATFGSPEVAWGIVAAEGGLVRLPHRIPYHVAVRLLLTGELLPAADAKRYGLVNELTASGGALDKAQELAARIAKNAPLAVAAIKQVLRATQGLSDNDAFERQDEIISPVLASEDAHEGATAFAQRRTPVWHGR
jgi:enoyl-CoA hydratase